MKPHQAIILLALALALAAASALGATAIASAQSERPNVVVFLVDDMGVMDLFNLTEDPFEQNDLASSQPVDLRRMMQAIAELERHNAVYPVSTDKVPLEPKLP